MSELRNKNGLTEVEFNDIEYFFKKVKNAVENKKNIKKDLVRLSMLIDAFYTKNFA